MRFGFGANWANFVETSLSDEKISQSVTHLKEFLRVEDLKGKSFIDIGSGSGLHSLAAFRLGASRIFSFDYDENSVSTTRKLRESVGSPSHWSVEQGSVLDADYMAKCGQFDVTYSWGVLHHTGDMWTAIGNALTTVKPDGIFYVALYSPEIYVAPPSHHWLHIKRQYNSATKNQKRKMELQYAWNTTIRPAIRAGQNPLAAIRQYGMRGMSFWTDVRDWLGGYPMDFAGFKDTVLFCKKGADLDLVNVKAGEGNTEFLFANVDRNAQWGEIAKTRRPVAIAGPYQRDERYMYSVPLAELKGESDAAGPRRSRLMMFEDGAPLGLAHSSHEEIRSHGLGRFSHWDDRLYFSASDCTDPNINGRTYSYVATY